MKVASTVLRGGCHREVVSLPDGIGIPAAEIPKLFERFYRVENTHGRSYEGTGIGLSLVQELVKLQGGTITVESKEGEGTTFCVTMPLGVKHPQSEIKTSTQTDSGSLPHHAQTYMAETLRWSSENKKESVPNSKQSQKGHILVADDNADMREFIKRLLEDAGYSVSLAVDGEDAWNICQSNLPDLVLSDVMMPKLDGFEFLKKVRSAEYTYSLPIILISARAGEVDKAEGLMSGADDYLSKPFHSGELIARVDGAVKLGKYRKKAHEELLSQTNRIAKIGGWNFDVTTMKGEWTDELIRIHDLPPNTTIDVNKGLEFYTQQSRPIIEKAVQEAVAFGKPYDLQLEIISAAGIHKWVRTVGIPVVEEGKIVKVHGVLQDITELKLSEIESQRNLLKYQNLFESSQEALMTFSPQEGKFTRANQSTLKLFGVETEAEFLAIGPANVSPIFQPDGRRSDEKSNEMIDVTLREGSNLFEWRHQRKNGEIFDADVLLTRMKNGGTTPFIQAAVRDITERKQSEERLHATLLGIVGAISGMVEMRDPYTAGHEKRVALLACAIAKELGINEERIEGLQLAAEIHDLGKIQIPAEILVKPTRLSELEFKMIQTHPETGYELLKDIEFPWPIAQMIRQHHEKLDGSGYPIGIKGDEILLEAQILSVADIVESMVSHRPYRPALGVDAAFEEIQRMRGTKLDEKVVDICIALFKENRFSF